jgi:hypothetical protein
MFDGVDYGVVSNAEEMRNKILGSASSSEIEEMMGEA